ncbi:hypothetical protein ACFSTD_14110 [Novosphingobium colocasiae]
MTRRLNLLLLVFIATIGFPFYWYFLDNGLGTAHPRPLTMAQLRELAASLPGEPPLELRHEMLGYRLTMRNLTEAGGGVRDTRTSLRAYQVRLTDGRTIAIGRGIGAKRARKTDLLGYDPDAQHRVDEAVRRASIHLLLSPAPRKRGRPAGRTARRPFPPGYRARRGGDPARRCRARHGDGLSADGRSARIPADRRCCAGTG